VEGCNRAGLESQILPSSKYHVTLLPIGPLEWVHKIERFHVVYKSMATKRLDHQCEL
jgi:hypothetical protein